MNSEKEKSDSSRVFFHSTNQFGKLIYEEDASDADSEYDIDESV